MPAAPDRTTFRLAGTPASGSGSEVAEYRGRSENDAQIVGPWSAPLVAAVERKFRSASDWTFANTSNVGATPNARTAIGTTVPPASYPIITRSTGSLPPEAGTVPGPTSVSRTAGRTSVTRMVSGS